MVAFRHLLRLLSVVGQNWGGGRAVSVLSVRGAGCDVTLSRRVWSRAVLYEVDDHTIRTTIRGSASSSGDTGLGAYVSIGAIRGLGGSQIRRWRAIATILFQSDSLRQDLRSRHDNKR
jgi:hypothetical protein